MSIFDYLRERPLIEAIKEWFHNLVESFIDVSSDVADFRNGAEVEDKVLSKNIEQIEKDHLKGDSYIVHYKENGRTVKATVNTKTYKKIKEKAPNKLDLER